MNLEKLTNMVTQKSAIESCMNIIWHHHENIGRMQLIPEALHRETGHDGGMKLWPFLTLKDLK